MFCSSWDVYVSFFFFSKTEKVFCCDGIKVTNRLITRLRLKDWEVFQEKWKEVPLFKDNSAECGFTKCSLAAVRKAFMLLQTWRRDNEFLISEVATQTPQLWWELASFMLPENSTSFHHLAPLVATGPQDTPDCSSFSLKWNLKSTLFFVVVVYCTRVPLMLAPECLLNSLSGRRQKTIFAILSTKKVEIWRTLKVI